MKEELIAPCGMNCAVCSGHLALSHNIKSKGIRMSYCTGCRHRNKQCAFLKKRCQLLSSGQIQYCYECRDFPCEKLSHLDRRYRSLYHMSMIENLEYIKTKGITAFLEKEERKWRCGECGETTCCHNGICFNCGLDKLKAKKNIYRWEE